MSQTGAHKCVISLIESHGPIIPNCHNFTIKIHDPTINSWPYHQTRHTTKPMASPSNPSPYYQTRDPTIKTMASPSNPWPHHQIQDTTIKPVTPPSSPWPHHQTHGPIKPMAPSSNPWPHHQTHGPIIKLMVLTFIMPASLFMVLPSWIGPANHANVHNDLISIKMWFWSINVFGATNFQK